MSPLLVFNGDFNFFNIAAEDFAKVNDTIRQLPNAIATAGNVEFEISHSYGDGKFRDVIAAAGIADSEVSLFSEDCVCGLLIATAGMYKLESSGEFQLRDTSFDLGRECEIPHSSG